MKKACCISLGIENNFKNHPKQKFQDFSRGLERIKNDLVKEKFKGDFISWNKDYPEEYTIKSKKQYAFGAFKPFCFSAAQKMGYELILWLDSSIKINAPIDSLFNIIEKEGYLIFKEYHSIGEFCSDAALKTLNLKREESFLMPSCWTSVLGLNLSNKTSKIFLEEWKEKALDGITFPGPKWSGVLNWPRKASKHPKVKGHRHDQTAASVIALKLGMNNWKDRLFFNSFFVDDREYVRKYEEKFLQSLRPILKKGRVAPGLS